MSRFAICRYLPAALASIARDLARAHGRRLTANVAHAALWIALLGTFTAAAPQASTYDLERRVAALEREQEYVRNRVNAQDVTDAARFAAIESRQASNTEKVNMVLGVFTGVGSLLLAGLCFRIFGKKNGNGNGNGDRKIL